MNMADTLKLESTNFLPADSEIGLTLVGPKLHGIKVT